MTWGWLIVATLIGLGVGFGCAAWMVARGRRGALPIDVPDPRRLHAAPTPRGGGLGIIAAGLVALPFACGVAVDPVEGNQLLLVVLAWAVPNGIMGTIDDHRELSPRVKLALQVGLAIAAAFIGLRVDEVHVPPLGVIHLGVLGPVFSVMWLVWVANLFNFMDGMDALAAECGTLFFAGFALLAMMAGADGHVFLSTVFATALLGFLPVNLPPARIFMGDGASLFAGAAMGGVSLALSRGDVAGVPLAASALLAGSFAFDATITVVRRLLRGLALRPHRTHFYQRLVLAGWAQSKVRLLYVALTLLGFVGALAVWRGTDGIAAVGLIMNGLALGSVVVVTRRIERRAR